MLDGLGKSLCHGGYSVSVLVILPIFASGATFPDRADGSTRSPAPVLTVRYAS